MNRAIVFSILLAAFCFAAVHPVVQGGKVGLIDDRGVMVVPPKYDYANRGGTLLPVRVGSKWGYVDAHGREVIPPKIETGIPPVFCGDYALLMYGNEVTVLGRDGVQKVVASGDKGGACSEGLIPVRDTARKWRYLNASGKPEFEATFEAANAFSHGFAGVRLNGKWGFIDRSGKMIIEPRFQAAGLHAEGRFPVRLNDRWGYADKTANLVIPAEYDVANPFSEGRAAVAKVVERGLTRFGYIDAAGRPVTPFRFTIGTDFTAGRAMVIDNGKFGFIGPDGSFAISPKYDDARPFEGGLAPVKVRSGKTTTAMYINTAGQVVWKGEDIP
jgi:hypothetical protein